VEDRKIDICCGLVSGYTVSIAAEICCGLIFGYTAKVAGFAESGKFDKMRRAQE
jgi:hypothetical protein